MDMAPTLRAKVSQGASPEYAILFQHIPFPRSMSENTVDIISRFLDVSEKTRLGAGQRGNFFVYLFHFLFLDKVYF